MTSATGLDDSDGAGTIARQRVLLVITKGDLGGAQAHVVELCRSLSATVEFAAVIGGDPGSHLERQLDLLGVKTLSAPRLQNSLNPIHLVSAVIDLLLVMRRVRPDVVHAHSAVAGVVSRIAARYLGLPVVYTVHGFGFKPEAKRLARWHARLAETALAAWTTRMVCVSRHELKWAEQLPIEAERVCVVPNVVSNCAPLSDPCASPTVVMVARMAPPKRHDLLLHASALLAQQDVRLPTMLVGSGPDESKLKHLASALSLHHITFSGDRTDVAHLLAQHSIFVLVSDHEGMPISIIEAMRAGMAIVATRLPGVQELVEHEHSALLVDADPTTLADALMRLAQDAPLRERLGKAARTRYEQQHQPEQAAAAMQDIYEEVPLIPNSSWPFARHRHSPVGGGVGRPRSSWTQLVWTAAGMLWFVLAWRLSLWLESTQVVTFVFGQTLLASLIPYAVACHLVYTGTRLPAAERTGLVLVTSVVPFALMPLFFALAQSPYSRGALLLGFVLTVLWFGLTWRWLQPFKAPTLVYWRDDQRRALRKVLEGVGIDMARLMQEATALKLIRWPRHWEHAPNKVPRQLAVNAALHRMSRSSLNRADHDVLSALKLRGIRLYTPEAVAEALSGRIPATLMATESWQPEGDARYDLVKRAMDATLVLLTLPIWLPLTLVVAVLVRIDSPGPVLFSQWRAGKDGRPFLLHKFRSMRHEDTTQAAQFAQRDDKRVTPWGRIMRRTRLDELPQLWNVLMGDMSLIGPRPEQMAFVDQFAGEIPSYPYRHLVRPGLTGWAQVHQGYAAGPEETAVKLSYDLYYVVHYSLAMDLLILAKTVRTVISGRGSR